MENSWQGSYLLTSLQHTPVGSVDTLVWGDEEPRAVWNHAGLVGFVPCAGMACGLIAVVGADPAPLLTPGCKRTFCLVWGVLSVLTRVH